MLEVKPTATRCRSEGSCRTSLRWLRFWGFGGRQKKSKEASWWI
ncbi:unnamed protein product [Rhodiola kirilowii]